METSGGGFSREELGLVINKSHGFGVGTCDYEECQALIKYIDRERKSIFDFEEFPTFEEITVWNRLFKPMI